MSCVWEWGERGVWGTVKGVYVTEPDKKRQIVGRTPDSGAVRPGTPQDRHESRDLLGQH